MAFNVRDIIGVALLVLIGAAAWWRHRSIQRRMDTLEQLLRESLKGEYAQRLRLIRLNKRLGRAIALAEAAGVSLDQLDDRVASLQERYDDAGC